MKKLSIIIIGIGLIILSISCRKEYVAPINQLVKDLFCFKTGSEWTYYDSVNQTTHKMVITDCVFSGIEATPKGGGKAYNVREYIKINGKFLTDFEVSITALGDEKEYENTATFSGYYISHGTPLRFKCDKNNNFTPSAIYLSTYTLNETVYSNVYVFNCKNNSTKDEIICYVSKNIGIVRCIYKDDEYYNGESFGINYDFVLIDKNVKQ